MNNSRFRIILLIWIVFVLQAPCASAQSKRLTITISKEPLEKVLFRIEKETNAEIVFCLNDVQGIRVSGDFYNIPVGIVLKEILQTTNLQLKSYHNILMIVKEKNNLKN